MKYRILTLSELQEFEIRSISDSLIRIDFGDDSTLIHIDNLGRSVELNAEHDSKNQLVDFGEYKAFIHNKLIKGENDEN